MRGGPKGLDPERLPKRILPCSASSLRCPQFLCTGISVPFARFVDHSNNIDPKAVD